MYRQHFSLRCASLDTDCVELWNDGALTGLAERSSGCSTTTATTRWWQRTSAR